VRNSEADLPRWFASVREFADVVVALDDGSTDGTRALLEAESIVQTVLDNPRRETYAGWDDAANRQRLINSVEPLAADRDVLTWILQLDADEVLAPGDGAALRHVVDHAALDPSKGYLLQILRMVAGEDGADGYDQDHLWVGRLFAWRPGISLPIERLHLVPLPVDIAPSDRVRTTLRIQHYGSFDDRRRQARIAKYTEVDSEHRWQADYSALGARAGHPAPVRRRARGLPVVPHAQWPAEADEARSHPEGEPLLTVVIISRDDEQVIERAVDGVLGQACGAQVQVVVVTSGTDRTADIVRDRYPQVELVELDHPALPGEARNAGLAVARGRYVTFPGSHIELPSGSLAARLQAHLDGWGMVTCTTENGTRTMAGWASYFLDHSGGLPARPSHAMTVAPSYASYLTEALRYVGGYPEHMRTAEDTVANTALFDLGYGAWREQHATMIHHSPCRRPVVLLRHHHRRGMGYGQMVRQQRQPDEPLLSRRVLRSLGPRYVIGRLRRVHRNVWLYGDDLRWRWVAVSPLALAGIVAAWAGAWRELLAPRRGWWSEAFAGRLHPSALSRRGRRP
jgi:glycosyltransferase involved in cell wall biosynthesis